MSPVTTSVMEGTGQGRHMGSIATVAGCRTTDLLCQQLLEMGLERGDVIALGGGVSGSCGLLQALCRSGCAIPTTLLAQVDSSVK